MLNLHKVLIESERMEYEQVNGPIQSPNHFLQLLTGDPWFAWLRAISELIVTIDEKMDGKTLIDLPEYELVSQVQRLLVSRDTNENFAKQYQVAIDRDARVKLAHLQLLDRLPESDVDAE